MFFGDGASNRGTFHEAMNAASAWKLPVVFVNEMNCWASTTPYRTTCNVENISDRAAGYHVPGVIVDGQDVFAVYEACLLYTSGKKILTVIDTVVNLIFYAILIYTGFNKVFDQISTRKMEPMGSRMVNTHSGQPREKVSLPVLI